MNKAVTVLCCDRFLHYDILAILSPRQTLKNRTITLAFRRGGARPSRNIIVIIKTFSKEIQCKKGR
jgi:hypothetical protein